MRYLVRTLLGLGLMVGALVAVAYAVYQLLQIGTCASGGPFVPARQCPPGTERIALMIPAALIALFIGAGLYATRGRAPGSEREPVLSVIAIGWGGLFLGIAFACFWAVWGSGPDLSPDAKTGGLIVGFLFVPMGLLGVLPMLWAGKSMRAATQASGIGFGDAVRLAREGRKLDVGALAEQLRTAAGSAQAPAAAETGGGDAVSKLERLERLRRDGTIDDAEFARLKAQVIDKG